MAKASTLLVEKLNRDFLECGICLDRFQKPRALPCLHCFCHNCLVELCKGKKQVLCPNCKNSATVPGKGVSGFPAHFMLTSLRDTLDMEKQKVKEGTVYIGCSNCKLPGIKASVRCQDCGEFFCDICLASHNALQSMKRHKVVSVNDLYCGKAVLPLTDANDLNCEEHEDEKKRFYCETCEKPVCRDCIAMKQCCRDHDTIRLKDAAKKQGTKLVELTKICDDMKKKYKTAIASTDLVENNLSIAVKKADKKLMALQKKYKEQVDAAFTKHKQMVQTHKKEQAKKLKGIKEELHKTLAKFDSACDLSSKVTQVGSDFDIASNYPTLSVSLEQLSQLPTEPAVADKKLGFFVLQEFSDLCIPDVVCMSEEGMWKQINKFSTDAELNNPQGIAIHPSGDVALTSYHKLAKVFTRNGKVKHSFKGPFDAWLYDIAITPYNQYVLPGKGKILFHDSEGNRLGSIPVRNTSEDTKPSNPRTLAVDPYGTIIAGLEGSRPVIHSQHAAGSILSFAVDDVPLFITTTCARNIAVSFMHSTLKVMDYSGRKVRVVQRPADVQDWTPKGVCSSGGELFVVNCGEPKAVYRYTADGDQCLGCIISGLDQPKGIAISQNGQKLYVVESAKNLVKIFKRQ